MTAILYSVETPRQSVVKDTVTYGGAVLIAFLNHQVFQFPGGYAAMLDFFLLGCLFVIITQIMGSTKLHRAKSHIELLNHVCDEVEKELKSTPATQNVRVEVRIMEIADGKSI